MPPRSEELRRLEGVCWTEFLRDRRRLRGAAEKHCGGAWLGEADQQIACCFGEGEGLDVLGRCRPDFTQLGEGLDASASAEDHAGEVSCLAGGTARGKPRGWTGENKTAATPGGIAAAGRLRVS
jgi:hypothetical protein